MDFRELRQRKVWITATWGKGPSDEFPDRQPDVIRVAYCPGALGDEDAVFLAQANRMRLADWGDAPPPPQVENRAQKRARERMEARAASTPPGKSPDLPPTAVEFLKRLVVDWDLMDGDKPWPPTAEHFGMLELGLRREIVYSIMVDYVDRPNSQSSLLSSSEQVESGQTGPTSASAPSNGATGNSRGTTPATQSSDQPPSGPTG